MKYDIKEVSTRLKATRESLDLTVEHMARVTNISVENYLAYENGEKDISLSELNECAEALGVEMIELLTGNSPTLQKYSLVRKGNGLPVERRIDFTYQHMAYLFKNKKIEPLFVTIPYEPDLTKPIHLSVHEGQEMDYILKGKLKFNIGNKTEYLNEGDCIYYDSSNPHGMIAIDGDCELLAIII